MNNFIIPLTGIVLMTVGMPTIAQQSESGVQVIGPQSTVEQYNAPVLPQGSAEGMIDFRSWRHLTR